MNTKLRIWNGVPIEKTAQWQATFDHQTDLFVRAPCPVCGEVKLRQYYQLEKSNLTKVNGRDFVGMGSYWAWCASCGAYEHASTLVPADWCGVALPLDHAALTPLPTELEAAVMALEQRK